MFSSDEARPARRRCRCDDLRVNGAEAALSSAAGEWFQTTGVQDNNWTLQVVASCDLTPDVSSAGEITDGSGNWVYRLEGDLISCPRAA